MNKLIVSVENFGFSKLTNKVILDCYLNGCISAVSVMANGEAFSSAFNEILPECPYMDVGVQLNLTQGKSLTNCDMLTDKNGNFNKGWFSFCKNSEDSVFLEQLEKEVRAQIERILEHKKISFLSSNSYIHMIPNIFKLCVKLAVEYQIPCIRTYNEKIVFVEDYKMLINIRFIKNLIKTVMLNYLSTLDKKLLSKSAIYTSDYTIGNLYKGMISSDVLSRGLEAIKNHNLFIDLILSPQNIILDICSDLELITNRNFEYNVNNLGFDIINYRNLNYE